MKAEIDVTDHHHRLAANFLSPWVAWLRCRIAWIYLSSLGVTMLLQDEVVPVQVRNGTNK
jgi:hypothetical protein